MKFLQSASFLLTALAVYAQKVTIGYPPDGIAVSAGQSLVVEIDRQSFISSATEVAVVIGLSYCDGGSCLPPSESIGGAVLYNGPYNPQPHENTKPSYENFTVTVPEFASSGLAQLNVLHVSLVGAIGEPFVETLNVTLNYTA